MKNGALQDLETGKIVKGAVLDPDSARALVQKRVAARRAVVLETANGHAAAGNFRAAGDLAYLAAITRAAMSKATNPSDPKMIEAANWVTRAAGDNIEGDSGGDSSIDELRGLIRDLAGLARAVAEARNSEDNNNYVQS